RHSRILCSNRGFARSAVTPQPWHGQCCSPAVPEHGLSQSALTIAHPFGFPVTNSMLVTWIVAVGLIVFAQLATRRMSQVPGGAQNFMEWIVEALYGLLESIIGR